MPLTEGEFWPKRNPVEACQFRYEEEIPSLVVWCTNRGIKFNVASTFTDNETIGAPDAQIEDVHFLVWVTDGYYELEEKDWVVFEPNTKVIRLMSEADFESIYEED